jgi:hypothetical protein
VLIDGNKNSPVKIENTLAPSIHETLSSSPDPHTSNDDANLNLDTDAESFNGAVIFNLAG